MEDTRRFSAQLSKLGAECGKAATSSRGCSGLSFEPVGSQPVAQMTRMLTLKEAIICNLYSIPTNQAAIIALFRVINRHVGNLPPMPGVFPDYPAPVIRNTGAGREMVTMRWGMPPPPKIGGPPVTNIRNTSSPHWRGWLKPENRCLVPT